MYVPSFFTIRAFVAVDCDQHTIDISEKTSENEIPAREWSCHFEFLLKEILVSTKQILLLKDKWAGSTQRLYHSTEPIHYNASTLATENERAQP